MPAEIREFEGYVIVRQDRQNARWPWWCNHYKRIQAGEKAVT